MLVEGLTKSVGSKMLFSDISFALNEGDRIALVARNGTGKSTLMNILMGKTDYDRGTITRRNGIKVGYLPQSPLPTSPEGEENDYRSGGERKKQAIMAVLAEEPDVLLLDEPTNHLDLDTVAWLEDQLQRTRLTILMVTHDRWFLDRICNTIIEMDQNRLYTYRGNYGDYLEQRAARIEQQNAEADKYRNLYRTELDWMRRMPQARGHKARYRIDNFYEIEKKAKATVQEHDVNLAIESGYIGNKIFEAKQVSKAFGEKLILKDFNYVFARYEKLGIIGGNGTGKSTFLKLLLGELQPDSGHFDIGTTIRFGYYSQTGLEFEPGKKVIEVVRDIAETVDMGDGNRLTASQFLQHFLFSPNQQYDYVEKLSGGEKRRLHLCTVLMTSPNFLVLDEPTNDLDIPTLNVLEEYLRAFRGCLIVVSHDRYFMDKVVDHLFVFHGHGEIKDFPGNYTQWRDSLSPGLKATLSPGGERENTPVENKKVKTEQKRRLTFAEKKELETLEKHMPELEAEKSTLEIALSGGLSDMSEIAKASKRYEEVKNELDEAELRWLELKEIE